MNQKELQEVRRQLKWDNPSLRILGLAEAYCHPQSEEHKIMTSRILDWNLVEKEEGELYLALMKKCLSGTLGKNLLELEFEPAETAADSLQQRLYLLKNGDLLKEGVFEEITEEILTKGDYRNSVYVTCLLAEYSAANMNSARESLEGFSNYRFLIFAVTEAKLTEIGLFYNQSSNQVERKVNTEMVIPPAPADAFLYPSFSERASDVNHILYHCKNPKTPNIDLIETFLQIPFERTAHEQNTDFIAMMNTAFEDRLDAKTAIALHKNLSAMMETQSEEEGTVTLDAPSLQNMLRISGADSASLEKLDHAWQQVLEDQSISAVNVLEKGKISIKAPSISVSVKDDALDKVSTRRENGKSLLVIELDEGMEISGLNIHV